MSLGEARSGDSGEQGFRGDGEKTSRVWRPQVSIGTWTGVVSLAAVPSFLLGLSVTNGRWIGMTLGIVVFIAGYVAADRVTFDWRLREDRRWQLALRSTYVTRMAILVLFPVAFGLDMFCGIFSTALVETISGATFMPTVGAANTDRGGMSELLAFFTTLVQGTIMHVPLMVAFGFWALVYAVAMRGQPAAASTTAGDSRAVVQITDRGDGIRDAAAFGDEGPWSAPVGQSDPPGSEEP